MSEPKKLYRIEQGKVIAGVCGGIAEFFNIDPNLIRIATVLATFFGGMGLWVYLVCAFILPRKSDVYPGY